MDEKTGGLPGDREGRSRVYAICAKGEIQPKGHEECRVDRRRRSDPRD